MVRASMLFRDYLCPVFCRVPHNFRRTTTRSHSVLQNKFSHQPLTCRHTPTCSSLDFPCICTGPFRLWKKNRERLHSVLNIMNTGQHRLRPFHPIITSINTTPVFTPKPNARPPLDLFKCWYCLVLLEGARRKGFKETLFLRVLWNLSAH